MYARASTHPSANGPPSGASVSTGVHRSVGRQGAEISVEAVTVGAVVRAVVVGVRVRVRVRHRRALVAIVDAPEGRLVGLRLRREHLHAWGCASASRAVRRTGSGSTTSNSGSNTSTGDGRGAGRTSSRLAGTFRRPVPSSDEAPATECRSAVGLPRGMGPPGKPLLSIRDAVLVRSCVDDAGLPVAGCCT